jgi:hypothetical protein
MVYSADDSAIAPALLGAQLSRIDDTAQYKLGTRIETIAGTILRYVLNDSTAKTQYEAQIIDKDWKISGSTGVTTTLAATAPVRIGWPQQTGGFTASKYGWVATGGVGFRGKVAASCAADVELYTTATGGVLDDTATKLVTGVKATTAVTTAADTPLYSAVEAMIPTDA